MAVCGATRLGMAVRVTSSLGVVAHRISHDATGNATKKIPTHRSSLSDVKIPVSVRAIAEKTRAQPSPVRLGVVRLVAEIAGVVTSTAGCLVLGHC